MRGFGSDNHSGIHPLINEALMKANVDHAPSYGTDEVSERLNAVVKEHFGPQARAFCVYNGTAANVLCIRSVLRPWQSVLCSDISHLNLDECGSPEALAGVKLIPLSSVNGKITVAALAEAMIRKGDQHYSQPGLISITQPTEVGTCYSLEEIRQISQFARANNLYLHVDGARLANAVVFLGTSFAEMISQSGVDLLSLGGTKNGLMMGELVLFLNPKLGEDFKYVRKQAGQLPSKCRFIAAQFEAYLQSGLWREIAQHSLKMAAELYREVSTVPDVTVEFAVQSNAVFARLPKAWLKTLREKYFFYVWDEKTWSCRLMTSFDTRSEDIQGFIALMRELSHHRK